ncbi:unnamed protein product [Phytomonas sp. EM1]|nr:unnamed protein product [Phytomonas sp. EM1]|eukprot:CCW64608.1 unnamed protein product [Phytomonas sp. isolate EM1]
MLKHRWNAYTNQLFKVANKQRSLSGCTAKSVNTCIKVSKHIAMGATILVSEIENILFTYKLQTAIRILLKNLSNTLWWRQ